MIKTVTSRNLGVRVAYEGTTITTSNIQGDVTDSARQWKHDFRDALSGTLLSASAARLALESGRTTLALDALTRLEAGCSRCMKLLDGMPLD